ncbi:MAG: hypothetical protein M3464_13115 [Chloroflexota bacterium]|nr:hypothetical protein [Chloroflexota bacterium]
MEARRFDHLTRSLVRNLPRRGLLGGLAAAVSTALVGRRAVQAQLSEEDGERTVAVSCRPCNCDAFGENCECCLNGVTGGGIVRTEVGDATLVLFTTELGDEAERQATGFVRWIDPSTNGGMTLESVGPIAYAWELENEQEREIRGTMAVNGEGTEPFVLYVTDAGPDQLGNDTARLDVGDLDAAEGSSERFGYRAAGIVVGGDIQLLDTVTPV